MNLLCQRCCRWVFPLLTLVLIGIGCGGTEKPEAVLTTKQTTVERIRQGDSIRVEEDKTVEIQVADQISVKEQGRALLRFRDRLEVEVFRGTETLVGEARLAPGANIFVKMRLMGGHTRTQLDSIADARITWETDYATIKALDDNTQILLCHADEVLTCMVTVAGKAEVEAQGQVITVQAGEASFILPGEPPIGPICAYQEEVNRWVDMKRGAEELDPLGALVAGWPQQPC